MAHSERARLGLWAAAIAAGLSAACSTVLSLGDYAVKPEDRDAGVGLGDASGQGSSTPKPSTEASVPASDSGVAQSGAPDSGAALEASCQASAAACYACTPILPTQFLNACTGAGCVPFDDARLTGLLPDGALPSVPQKDGAIE